MSRYAHAAILLLVASVTPVAAQEEPREVVMPERPSPQAFINIRGFSDDYQVGPGDMLDLQVIGHEDLHQSVRVSNSGEISVPMLGLVRVLDMTTFEIEDEIARRLREADLVHQAEVLVFVQQYQAKPIFVMGAVTTPGEFIMSQAMTVTDAVLLAGGLRLNAADEALLYRRASMLGTTAATAESLAANPVAPRPGLEVIKVDLTPLKQGQFLASTPALRRGDVLVVPDRILKQFYVVGEVLDPRNFLYTPDKLLMASQAISWAGGPTPTAKMSEGMLVRFDEFGSRTEKTVDWSAILNGKQPDFPIQPDDIIFVPGSKIKTITHGMLQLTSTMVMSASFRVARSYQMPDAPGSATQPRQ